MNEKKDSGLMRNAVTALKQAIGMSTPCPLCHGTGRLDSAVRRKGRQCTECKGLGVITPSGNTITVRDGE